jgi:hypothetical protein
VKLSCDAHGCSACVEFAPADAPSGWWLVHRIKSPASSSAYALCPDHAPAVNGVPKVDSYGVPVPLAPSDKDPR